MIPLNDQDVEALLKMSDKELVKLAVVATAAIRLRRDAAHVQHLPDIEVERKQVRRVLGFPGQDAADHRARRSPSGPAPAPAGKSRVRDLGEGPLWQGFNCRKALGQEKCDAWDTAGRLSRSPFTRAASASSGDRSSSAGRLNGGNVSAAMAAIAARRLNSCSVMALLLEPAQFATVQPVG
jgi:hypothetical protein